MKPLFRLPLIASLFALLASGAALAQPAARGNTLVAIVQPEPTALTTTINNNFPNGVVSVNIYDGLVTYDENLSPQPALAEKWTIAPDGKSITFNLRRGVKWHDGHDFTSADVKFSLLEVWKKFHSRGRITFASVEAVDTPDPYTAILRLSKPALVIMSALNSMEAQILPRHLYEGTDVTKNPRNLAPIGTGPFKFKEWKKGQYIELERNPNYWDKGKPYLDRVIFRVIPDAATRAAALETGEVQYAPYDQVPFSDIERIRKLPNLAIETRGYDWQSQYFFIEFNLRNPLFKDVRVRQAFAHAIDRNGLIKTVWYGLGKPATGPIPSTLRTFYSPEGTQYPFDPAKAEKLLDEAGYPRKAGGVRFTINQDYMPFNEAFKNSAEYIRQNLKRVGIEVTVRNQDLASYVKRVYGEYDFDIHSGQFSSFMDPQMGVHRQFWSKAIQKGIPWTNASGYSNPELDRVIEATQVEPSRIKRVSYFHDLQRIAQQDLPIISLFEIQHFTVHSRKLQGLSTSPDGALSSLKDARLAR